MCRTFAYDSPRSNTKSSIQPDEANFIPGLRLRLAQDAQVGKTHLTNSLVY